MQVLFSYMVIEFTGNVASLPKKAARTCSAAFSTLWRREGDSNPRDPLGVNTLSRRAS